MSIIDILTFAAPTTADATVSSTAIVDANAERDYLLITNLTTTTIYLSPDNAAVAGKGIPLVGLGSNYEMLHGKNLSRGAVYAIHGGSGSKAVAIQEA